MTTATEYIKSEMELRIKLVENEEFRQVVADAAQKMGISREDWEKTKTGLWLAFANQFLSDPQMRETVLKFIIGY